MKKLLSPILLVCLLTASASLAAEEKDRFGIGGRIQPGNWNGNNSGDSSSGFDSDTTMYTFTFRYQKGLFYSGATLQGGEFSFTDNAPNQNNTSTAIDHSAVKIDRGEFDLIAGYYFWPRVSLFVDLKAVTSQWLKQNYTEEHTGLGIGISTFMPLQNNWTLYASFGYVPLKLTHD